MCGNDSFFHMHNPCSATYRHNTYVKGFFSANNLKSKWSQFPCFLSPADSPSAWAGVELWLSNSYQFCLPFLYGLTHVAKVGSVFTTLAVSLERYFAVCKPLWIRWGNATFSRMRIFPPRKMGWLRAVRSISLSTAHDRDYFSLPLWKTRRTKCDKVAFQTDCRHLALKRRSRNQIDVSWAISLSAHSSRCLTYSSSKIVTGISEHGLQEIIWVEITGSQKLCQKFCYSIRGESITWFALHTNPKTGLFDTFWLQELLILQKTHKILENSSIFEVWKTILILVSFKIYKMRTLQLDLIYKWPYWDLTTSSS